MTTLISVGKLMNIELIIGILILGVICAIAAAIMWASSKETVGMIDPRLVSLGSQRP